MSTSQRALSGHRPAAKATHGSAVRIPRDGVAGARLAIQAGVLRIRGHPRLRDLAGSTRTSDRLQWSRTGSVERKE
jgi:hypothetical protein